MSTNNHITSLGSSNNDPLGLNNPTPIILALVNKMILCMLLVANSVLFNTQALNKKSQINPVLAISVSFILIILACGLCLFAGYEYFIVINKYIGYCNNKNNKNTCLYSSTTLFSAKIIYSTLSILFIFACFLIGYIQLSKLLKS